MGPRKVPYPGGKQEGVSDSQVGIYISGTNNKITANRVSGYAEDWSIVDDGDGTKPHANKIE